GLGDAGDLGQICLPEAMHEADHLAGQLLGRRRHPGLDDLELLLGRRVVDPVVQAATLERVMDLAGPVRGQDDARGAFSPDRADLWDRDLKSDRISRRYASNSSSARSISSISRTGATPSSLSSAWSNGRRIRKSEPKMSCALACSASPRASSRRISSI